MKTPLLEREESDRGATGSSLCHVHPLAAPRVHLCFQSMGVRADGNGWAREEWSPCSFSFSYTFRWAGISSKTLVLGNKTWWRRKWQPPSVSLPGESHGWRSLACCSPRGHKESDTTENTHMCSETWGVQDHGEALVKSRSHRETWSPTERSHAQPRQQTQVEI